jgi:tetratricopeptide (TPR) repeat protein
MKKPRNHTTLLNKYSLMYEKKPKSRVFAPLAEAYRKLGMIDEAMKILSQGIRNHPSYTLGYTVLANCYFDLKNYEMSYNTVRPFVSQNLENITLQKLFANTCVHLAYYEEALQTFKYLLLINPKDSSIAEQIKLLEDDFLMEEETVEVKPTNMDSSFDEDEWVQVNFSNEEDDEPDTSSVENWNISTASPLDDFKNEVKAKSIAIKEHDLNDAFFHEEYDLENEEVISTKEIKDTPIISHTLVDLYLKQGHLDKAASVLENILELHPDDFPTKERLDKITLDMINKDLSNEANVKSTESDLIIKNNNASKLDIVKKRFDQFHQKLVLTSEIKMAKA